MDLRNLTASLLGETLEQYLTASEKQSKDLQPLLSVGKKLSQRKSGASCSELQILGALASSHKQATAVRSQLRSWTETNGYALSLTTKQVLESLTYGSAKLTELVEADLACVFWVSVAERCFTWVRLMGLTD